MDITADIRIMKILTGWLKRIRNIRKNSMHGLEFLITEYLVFFYWRQSHSWKYENMLRDEIVNNTDYRWSKL